MKVNGIIAEYNPFHNGHLFQLQDAKAKNRADYTIIALSGNFVQRGTPALMDKYTRTRAALACGADLVLEIPVYYAASSAEFYATGAVTLLDKLGVVDTLCFGSECGDLAILDRIADILLEEPEEYVRMLKHHLHEGRSYPYSRTEALLQYDPLLNPYRNVLASANNILGIEYLKALKRRHSRIRPYTTMRIGADYRDKRTGTNPCSALAIRHALYAHRDYIFMRQQMPEAAYQATAEYLTQGDPVHIDDFSSILHYKLLMEQDAGYTKYLDVSSDLSARILNHVYRFKGFSDFCDLLKSKETTYARISRCLLHILLNMEKDTMELYQNMDYIPYARILGFRRESAPLLTALKEHTSIPMISKLADAKDQLGGQAFLMLQNEIHISDIYESTASLTRKCSMENEYRTPIVIL